MSEYDPPISPAAKTYRHDDPPSLDREDAYIAASIGEPQRCGVCGSTNIYLESPAEGWSCRNCGASDSDES
jgi:ribosomal protein L37AE/L43A